MRAHRGRAGLAKGPVRLWVDCGGSECVSTTVPTKVVCVRRHNGGASKSVAVCVGCGG
jgi:hypothetical protein